jgi:hypothetical protein
MPVLAQLSYEDQPRLKYLDSDTLFATDAFQEKFLV